jgi:hypothetical protein
MIKEILLFYPISSTESMRVLLRTKDGVCNFVSHRKEPFNSDITVWVNEALAFSEDAKEKLIPESVLPNEYKS